MASQRDIDAFHQAAEAGDFMAMMPMVQSNRAILRAKADHGDEPIHTACWQKQLMVVSYLIQQGVDVNARGCRGLTPLHCAVNDAGVECIPVVAFLIESGADPALRDENGFDVESWAHQEVFEGIDEVIELLANANPKPS